MSSENPDLGPLVARLTERLSDLSGYDPDELEPAVSFVELGFDSLSLTQVSQALKQDYGVDIKTRQLIEQWPCIDALAAHVAEACPDAIPAASESAAPAADDVAAAGPAAMLVEAMAQPQPAAAAAMQAPAAAAGSLQAIFAQQLQLMAQQLEMLGGAPAAAVSTAAAPAQAPASVDVQAAPKPAAASMTEKAKAEKKEESAKQQEGKGDGKDEKKQGVEQAASTPVPFGSAPGGGELTPHQLEHIDLFVARYIEKTPTSRAHTQAYRARHADPRTAAGFDRRWKGITYPLVVERSRGSKLWDVDGNEYVDLLNGFGPIMLGHSPDFVEHAVREQLDKGFEIGPQTPLAGETAELVCELTGMDRASFVCTGSEAVQAALRCARTVTGRTKVVTFTGDYHGNFDEVLLRAANRGDRLRTMPAAPGIARRAVEDMIVLPYGEAWSLEIVERLAPELAAVLVEPVQSRRPELQPREFLHTVREITRRSETALIFDEVVTGFRSHPGGAQAVFGVEADLATYGKVVAGGLPIGVVAGRDPWMDAFDGGYWSFDDDSSPEAGVTFFAGTFVRHPLAIAAAHAVLLRLKQEGPTLQEKLARTTDDFAARINALFEEYEVPAELPNFTSVLYLRLLDDSQLAHLFFPMLRHHGIHIQDGFPAYLTTAHSEADLDFCVDAFRNSIEAMQEAHFFAPPTGLRKRAPAPRPKSIANEPPVPGARLGRDPQGRPAWFVRDADQPGGYRQVG